MDKLDLNTIIGFLAAVWNVRGGVGDVAPV